MSSAATPPTTADLSAKISALHSRITKERKLIEGYQALRSATSNTDVIRSCESKMRDSQKTIGYFEDSLRDFEGRLNAAGGGLSSSGGAARGRLEGNDSRMRSLPTPPGAAGSDYARSQQRSTGGDRMGTQGVGGYDAELRSSYSRSKVAYTNLDLIKADTPLMAAKISRMLHQLEFKLHVERQYKDGIEKMAKLYQVDGDKKARADTESKRVESSQKMMLLSQALKRYKTLDIMGDMAEEEDDDISEDVKSNLRKPLSGTLQITIKSARDLAHAPQPKKSKHPSETVVYVKVEDTPRARTHPTRSDRWNEDFDITVDKANEVEVTIYDKAPGDSAPVPIGMLWLRLSDVVEELRRKKMGADAGPGWVTAERVTNQQGSGGRSGGGNLDLAMRGGTSMGGAEMKGGTPNQASVGDGVDAWFAVEPEGAIFLHLNFVKSNVRKRPADIGGLGRQGAVRKRKEEIHEQNGHKFIQKQFYTVVLCALCSEFLMKGAGMQCEDCKYACHKNCYPKVVTKCISKSNAESDKDQDKINHRIPHRFEPITNISPNWCCHCGMVLALGRKGARKCSECGVTAHGDCAHLVPDFCGMSMEMANKLLADIKTINSTRRPAVVPRPPKPTTARIAPPSVQRDADGYDALSRDLAADVGRLALDKQQLQQRSQPPASNDYQQQQQSYSRPAYDGQVDRRQDQDDRYHSQTQQQQQQQRLPSPNKSSSFEQGIRDTTGGFLTDFAEERATRSQQQQYPQQQQQQSQQQSQQRSQYSVPPVDPRAPRSAGIQPGQIFQHPSPDLRQQQQQQQQHQQQQQAYQQQPDARHHQQQQQQYSLPLPLPTAPTVAMVPRRPQQQAIRQRKIGLDDFNFLAVLGKGNFGKVMLAEEKSTSQLYAIKVLKKEFIIENDEVESTKSEKRVFLAAARERHPFLLGLHSCFQTETRIYFVMEYVSGGDLMLQIQREQFSPRRAKFYAAEVLLALEYFHQNGIVYRDLKLDNILLTLDGHVKVADYGLCKEDMWYGKTTTTFCGTPEFMAPEIILEQPYGRAVDWWAYGVLIYEMLLGQSPFRGDDEDEIFDAILEDEPLYPIHMPKDNVSILTKLLTRDPLRRLGSGETDAQEIKSHAFFKDTNWDDIMNKRVPSPFFPTIKSATDTSNFDSEFTSEQPTLTPVHSTLSAQDQGEFANFSWIAPWANEQ